MTTSLDSRSSLLLFFTSTTRRSMVESRGTTILPSASTSCATLALTISPTFKCLVLSPRESSATMSVPLVSEALPEACVSALFSCATESATPAIAMVIPRKIPARFRIDAPLDGQTIWNGPSIEHQLPVKINRQTDKHLRVTAISRHQLKRIG